MPYVRLMSTKPRAIWIGIDNGVTRGAIAAVDADGRLLAREALKNEPDVRGGNRLDVEAFFAQLYRFADLANGGEVVCTVERPGGSKDVRAACKMLACFDTIRAVCILSRRARFESITPHSWQQDKNNSLLKAPVGETKPYALAKAAELWPKDGFLESPRCSVPHDGMIDAALIAYFSMKNNIQGTEHVSRKPKKKKRAARQAKP